MSDGRFVTDPEQIFGIDDTQEKDVIVPEWNGLVVKIRGLTGDERDAYEAASIIGKGKNRDVNIKNMRARLIVACAKKPDGSPLFTAEHIERLGKRSGLALDRLFEVAKELSGLGDTQIEEMAGNSNSGQNGNGISSGRSLQENPSVNSSVSGAVES